MVTKIFLVLGCLVIPIFWGWVVHALFRFAERKRTGEGSDDSIFPDFQI